MPMNITTSSAEGRVPVTILHLEGALDASNYKDAIAVGQQAYAAGARDIVLDLSGVTYMSSSGLVALLSIARLLRGEKLPDPEEGWAAFRAIDRDRDSGIQAHLKLLSPQPQVDQVLYTVGFKRYLEVFTDLPSAVAAF